MKGKFLFLVAMFSLAACHPPSHNSGAATTSPPPPATTPSPTTGNLIYLDWKPFVTVDPNAVPPALYYNVYYGPDLNDSDMRFIRSVPADQTFTLNGMVVVGTQFDAVLDFYAVENQQLCFKLTAVNAAGESQKTDGICMIYTSTTPVTLLDCGWGLAARDLSGACRNGTPGALEAQQPTG